VKRRDFIALPSYSGMAARGAGAAAWTFVVAYRVAGDNASSRR
jgi:hypothetical protein